MKSDSREGHGLLSFAAVFYWCMEDYHGKESCDC